MFRARKFFVHLFQAELKSRHSRMPRVESSFCYFGVVTGPQSGQGKLFEASKKIRSVHSQDKPRATAFYLPAVLVIGVEIA